MILNHSNSKSQQTKLQSYWLDLKVANLLVFFQNIRMIFSCAHINVTLHIYVHRAFFNVCQ